MFRVCVTVVIVLCLVVLSQPLAISFTTPSLGVDGYDNTAQRVTRQTDSNRLSEDDLYCVLPPPLEHGRFSPSNRRCPPTTSSAACLMIPGTPVPPQWVIFHTCNVGYKLHNGKTLSVCAKGKWVPPLPVCLVDGCRLPVMPSHGWYEAASQCRPDEVGVAACRYVPGTLVPSNWAIRYSCSGPEYYSNSTSDLSTCKNNEWTNPVDCINKRCPPLIAQTVDISCTKNGRRVSCDLPMEVDTVATLRCKILHENKGGPQNHTISCLKSGEWSNLLLRCTPSSQASGQGGNPVSQGKISVQKCHEYSRFSETCSLNEPLRRKRVANGIDALPREFPHMAQVGYVGENNTIDWLCGGSLISERFVLSGATCVAGIKKLANWIRLGDYNQNSIADDEEKSAKSRVYEIVQRIPHPEHKSQEVYNDIVLFKLKKAVTFNEYVRPICLHTEPTIATTYAIATGWGTTEWGGKESDILQKANLTIFGKTECTDAYKVFANTKLTRGIDDASQLCAGDLENRRDTSICKGDSGGPLQIRLADPYCMYSLVGITSFGVKCATNYPSVFTRVSHYVPWIESWVWPQS